jgi:hypothetical protein
VSVAVLDHALAERRSLSYHDEIASRLVEDSQLLARARTRVRAWLEQRAVPEHYAHAWMTLLDRPLAELQRSLRDPGEVMTALRQVSPFAGALAPRERWRLWRAARTA